MLNKLLSVSILVSTFVLLNGCVNTNSSISSSHINPEYIVLSQPRVVSIADQTKAIRVKRALSSPNLTSLDRSKLLYEMGYLYDRIGENLMAELNLMGAIHENSQMSESYSYLAGFLARDGKFLEAYDAYDAAIELSPKLYSNYSLRGLTLYYGLRENMALPDLQKYYINNRQDPYGVLWLYIVESKLTPDTAVDEMRKRYRLINESDRSWLGSVIEVILGQKKESEFWANVFVGASEEEKPERLCEAYYYLGKMHQINGEVEKAKDYFRLSMMTNVTYFIEYGYSLMELERPEGYNAVHENELNKPDNSDKKENKTIDDSKDNGINS